MEILVTIQYYILSKNGRMLAAVLSALRWFIIIPGILLDLRGV